MKIPRYRNCPVCTKPITQESYAKCLRCGKRCELENKVIDDTSPDLVLLDSKSICCQDNVNFFFNTTCSAECKETLINALIAQYGEFKSILNSETGIFHKVPTKLILEEGIKGYELPNFPVWEEKNEST